MSAHAILTRGSLLVNGEGSRIGSSKYPCKIVSADRAISQWPYYSYGTSTIRADSSTRVWGERNNMGIYW